MSPESAVVERQDAVVITAAGRPARGPVSTPARRRLRVAGPPTRAAKWRARLLPYSVIALVLLAWWFVTANQLVPPAALPTPFAVATAAWQLTVSGALPEALGASLARASIGSAFGIITGISLGVIAGLSVLGQQVLDRPLQMLRMIPFNALAPLFILFLGIGEPMKIIVVAYAVALPLYINTFSGIRNVDRKLVEVATVYGVPRALIAVQVLLRGSLPSVLTGLRFALGIAWIALITVEVVNSRVGLGYQLNQAQQFARTEIILLVIVIYGLLGAITDWIVRLLERYLLRWRAAFDGR